MSTFSSITVIHFSGELELSRREELRKQLVLSGHESAVLVDFAEVTYADSTALAEILRFYRESVNAKIPLAILIHSPQFARVIEYAGLSKIIRVFNDRSEALHHLGTQRA